MVGVLAHRVTHCQKVLRKKKVASHGGFYCDWCTIVILTSGKPALLMKQKQRHPESSSREYLCEHAGETMTMMMMMMMVGFIWGSYFSQRPLA